MIFKTTLSAEQIHNILKVHAKPMTFSNMYTNNTLIYKFKSKKNVFYLIKIGDYFAINYPKIPFIGKITENPDGTTTIKGNFRPTTALKVLLCIFFGFAWASFLIVYFKNGTLISWPTFNIILALSIWTILGVLFITSSPNFLYGKSKKYVIDFINNNLVK